MNRLKALLSTIAASQEFKWYSRLIFGGCIVIVTAVLASSFTAKRAEGLVAAAVQVVNTPLPVTTEGSQRVPYTFSNNIGAGTVYGSLEDFTYPADQLLVIETVNASCNSSNGDPAILRIRIPDKDTGLVTSYNFPLTSFGYSSADSSYAQGLIAQTHLYAKPGNNPDLLLLPGTTDCYVAIGGFTTKP